MKRTTKTQPPSGPAAGLTARGRQDQPAADLLRKILQAGARSADPQIRKWASDLLLRGEGGASRG